MALISLISLSSALYAGECMEINLSELNSSEDILWFVVGNSSNLEGLNIELDGTSASVCPVVNYKPDKFTLVFFNKEKEIVIEYENDCDDCGRSSKKVYVDREIIKYVDREVPNYIDRIIYKENDTIREDDGLITYVDDKKIWKYASWSYWYYYLIILGILVLLVYLWLRGVYVEGEAEEEIDDNIEDTSIVT